MMKPFFESKERKKELKRVLKEWRGTPYRHLVAVKGLGADCTLFVWEVMKELGAMGSNLKNLPKKGGHLHHPKDRPLHSSEEVILNILRAVPYLKEIKSKSPIDGDICCYKFFKSTSHIAIYFEGRIHQSLTNSEVLPISFKDRQFLKRLTAIFRVMEM